MVQTGHSNNSWTLVAGAIAVEPITWLMLLVFPPLRGFKEENSEWWGWCWCGCWYGWGWRIRCWISSSSIPSEDETHSMLSKSMIIKTEPNQKKKKIPSNQNRKFHRLNYLGISLSSSIFSFQFKNKIRKMVVMDRWEKWILMKQTPLCWRTCSFLRVLSLSLSYRGCLVCEVGERKREKGKRTVDYDIELAIYWSNGGWVIYLFILFY